MATCLAKLNSWETDTETRSGKRSGGWALAAKSGVTGVARADAIVFTRLKMSLEGSRRAPINLSLSSGAAGRWSLGSCRGRGQMIT